MRFLVDNALSFRVAEQLVSAGYNAVHVRDYNLDTATDDAVLDRAKLEDRVIISADTDFGTLLAQMRTKKPSFILLRWPELRRAQDQVRVLLANLPSFENDLALGAIVVIEQTRIRVRTLPIGSDPRPAS